MPIPLIGPDGQAYELDNDDPAALSEVLRQGFKQQLEKYEPTTLGEQIAQTGAEAADIAGTTAFGALQGVTGGLAGAAIGAKDKAMGQFLQKQREAHPIASGVGEFAGMLASPVGEVGAAIKGGIKATTALGRIGASAAAGGAEGLLYGAGNTMSEAALGDTDLTAEKLIAGAGLGSLLGVAGGGLATGLGEGFNALAPMAGKALSGIKQPLEEFAEHRWLKTVGIQGEIKRIPEQERSAVANVLREAMSPAGKIMPASVDEAAQVVSAERDAVAKQLLKQMGVSDAGGLSSKMNQDEALEAIARGLQDNGERVGAVLKQADAMGATPSYASALKRFDDFEAGLNLAEKDLVSKELAQVRGYLTTMGSKPIGPDNSFSALNSIKSTIQKDTNFMADGSAKFGLKRQIAGILRDEIDTQLAPQIGSDLSKEFLEAKQAFGALSNAEKALGRKTSTGSDAIRALVDGADLAAPSLAGKLSALDHAANLIKAGQDRTFNRSVSLSDYLTGVGASALHGGPLGALTGLASSFGHKVMREHSSAVIAKLADSIARSPHLAMAAASFGKQLQAIAPDLGKYGAPLLQALAHNAPTAMATHMAMAQTDPHYADAAQKAGFLPETPEEASHAQAKGAALSSMAAQMDAQNAQLSRGLDAVFKGERVPHSSSGVMSSQDFGSKRMRKEGIEAHRKRVDEVRALASNPDALLERISGNTTEVSQMAPAVAAAMARTANTAVQYLAQVSKEPPKGGPLGASWHQTEAERHEFTQKLEVVQEPMSVLKHAASGTLTPGQWEAVRTVYPLLARQIQDMATERLADPPKSVPYKARLMLWMITGVDPDGSMGTGIALNQQAIASAMTNPSKPDAMKEELSVGNRTATRSQKREMETADG